MLKNLLKVAYRNIVRGGMLSLINISGLAIGMASALIILMWVQNEWTYDSFYPKSDRLFEAWNRDKSNEGIDCWEVTPKILGPSLKRQFPEIDQTTRVNWDESLLFTIGEKKMNVKGTMVDPDFLTMFEFPLLKGNVRTALDHPDDIVITEKLSTKLFGKEDPVGKVVRIDNKYNFKVSALMRDLPNNTAFDFEYLLPWSFMKDRKEDDSSWDQNSTRNFVLLKPHTDLASLNLKIRDIIPSHIKGEQSTVQSFLYPVSRLRLFSSFVNGIPSGGRIRTVRVFTLVALLILIIACINFINMSTARSEKRAREVGIRKVVGAGKKSLVGQFLAEGILLTALAGLLALLIVQVCLPSFNLLTSKELAIEFGSPLFWTCFAGFILMTGLMAGGYPAFYISSFRPASVLKGKFRNAEGLVNPRRVLVVTQFTVAIILVVCTLVIRQQVRYAQERETGYNRRNVVYSFMSGEIAKNYDLIKNELLSEGVATAVSKCSAPLTASWSVASADWQGKDPNDRTEFNFFDTDGDLVRTAGLQLVQGRDIDPKNYPTDSTAVILNESAVKAMGFKHPIGEVIDRGAWNTDWHVIGVVRDFVLQSPFDKIKPLVIQGPKANWFNLIHVRFNPGRSTAANLGDMEKIFRKYNPAYPFQYEFIDQEYAKKFKEDQTTETLTALFAALTIFISCLGLFGLSAYMAETKTKEIGVRKVLGASVANITFLLSREFVQLVFIAFVIATPIAWISMTRWLQGFDYRIGLSWWNFGIAGLLSLLIAFGTVSYQTIRAALAEPAKNLRTE